MIYVIHLINSFTIMNVSIKRIDPTLPLPEYHTQGAVAFDLYARETTVIPPRGVALVPANIVVAIPKRMMLLITSRSSTAMRKGLMLGNGVGTIDQDYCGSNDELKINTYNFTDNPVTVERAERIAQAIFVPIERVDFQEVEEMGSTSRGGFGTTGTHVNADTQR